ncbi:MAG: terminase family protein [Clostridia bacterium]|nr:terminase family protein [Clostridia bacterium]
MEKPKIDEPKICGFSLTEQKMLMQAGVYSLMDFAVLTNKNYFANWHHKLIAEELEKLAKGEVDWKLLILMLPPRSGKSELATILFPAWFLGNYPDKEIITSSYSAELAIDFGSKTRNLINSPEYKLIFPSVRLKEDEQSKAKWRTNKNGSYISTGIGGAITGYGSHIFIIDDPIKNREEADSQVIRNKHWDWFVSTAFTRLHPNGKIVLILTRWHLDDLAGRILENKELASRTKVISFPAIAEKEDEYRKVGEVLWPERYSLKEVLSIKESIGITNFASLYQQNPILSENQEFKPEWITYTEWSDMLNIKTRNFMTIDTAISKKDSADFTGITCNFVDIENKWHIKTYKRKLDPKELIDFIFRLNNEDGYEKIGVEETIYMQAIKPFLDDEMRRRNEYLNIVPLKHNQINKEVRIRGLIPRYQSKSIIHFKDMCEGLEEELFTFPKGVHDDVIDSLAYQIQIAESGEDLNSGLDNYKTESIAKDLI